MNVLLSIGFHSYLTVGGIVYAEIFQYCLLGDTLKTVRYKSAILYTTLGFPLIHEFFLFSYFKASRVITAGELKEDYILKFTCAYTFSQIEFILVTYLMYFKKICHILKSSIKYEQH